MATMTSHTFGPNLSIADYTLKWISGHFDVCRYLAGETSQKQTSGPRRRETVLTHTFRVARESETSLWTASTAEPNSSQLANSHERDSASNDKATEFQVGLCVISAPLWRPINYHCLDTEKHRSFSIVLVQPIRL